MLSGTVSRKQRKGAVLVAFAVSMVLMLGATGIAIDMGHMYIVRSELQAFVDSAALAGAAVLDGHSFTAAEAAVHQGTFENTTAPWKRWEFGSTVVANPTSGYAATSTGPFLAPAGLDPKGKRFIEVTASVQVPVYFTQLLGAPALKQVTARAVAGQVKMTSIAQGLLPFYAIAHNTSETTINASGGMYGFEVGKQYTIRWGANTKTDFKELTVNTDNWCSGDCGGPCAKGVVYNPWLAYLKSMNDAGTLEGRGLLIKAGAQDYRNIIETGYQDQSFTVADMTPAFPPKETSALATSLCELSSQIPTPIVAVAVVDPNTMAILEFLGFKLVPSTGPCQPPKSPQSSYDGTGQASWCLSYFGGQIDGYGKEPVNKDGIYEIRLVP